MKAELIDVMGNDLTVVNAARVSFNKQSYELDGKDEKLIAYLAKHKHFTPFTHPQITMRETVPIFVARQRFKHTVGFTYNEVSRRYVDDEPKFYTPDEWRSRPEGSVKQGSGQHVITDLVINEGSDYTRPVTDLYEDYMKRLEKLYTCMVNNGIAPEQARMVLPQSMYTSYYVTGSLAAWARAYNLRSGESSQKEIQMLAEQWDGLIKELFPVSWEVLAHET